MFKVGDLVRHKATGITGRVIGYGKREVTNSYYSNTLKVELHSSDFIKPMAEDVVEKWAMRRGKRILACTLPYFPKAYHSNIGSSSNYS